MIKQRGRIMYVSVRLAALRADVSTRTIKRWIRAGLLPAYRLPSPKARGHLRIRLSDLEALIARGIQMVVFVPVFQCFWRAWEDVILQSPADYYATFSQTGCFVML